MPGGLFSNISPFCHQPTLPGATSPGNPGTYYSSPTAVDLMHPIGSQYERICYWLDREAETHGWAPFEWTYINSAGEEEVFVPVDVAPFTVPSTPNNARLLYIQLRNAIGLIGTELFFDWTSKPWGQSRATISTIIGGTTGTWGNAYKTPDPADYGIYGKIYSEDFQNLVPQTRIPTQLWDGWGQATKQGEANFAADGTMTTAAMNNLSWSRFVAASWTVSILGVTLDLATRYLFAEVARITDVRSVGPPNVGERAHHRQTLRWFWKVVKDKTLQNNWGFAEYLGSGNPLSLIQTSGDAGTYIDWTWWTPAVGEAKIVYGWVEYDTVGTGLWDLSTADNKSTNIRGQSVHVPGAPPSFSVEPQPWTDINEDVAALILAKLDAQDFTTLYQLPAFASTPIPGSAPSATRSLVSDFAPVLNAIPDGNILFIALLHDGFANSQPTDPIATTTAGQFLLNTVGTKVVAGGTNRNLGLFTVHTDSVGAGDDFSRVDYA